MSEKFKKIQNEANKKYYPRSSSHRQGQQFIAP